ncbi:MAG: allophanate hydrolase [Elstera sp.]
MLTLADYRAEALATGSAEAGLRAAYAKLRAWDDPALLIALRPEEEAIAAARALTGRTDLPLFGVPFFVKDNIDVAGLLTTAACPEFAYTPEVSAFAVARLEAAGAIVIGKTNLDQFATGLVGVRSPYGVPRNSVRADLVPGGSSSGSATSVGAGIVPFALGTDTAGSGRVPAALNGIVGLKPTLGAVSARGMVPACRTLDTISVFALTADDAWTVYEILAGYDAADAYARPFALGKPGALVPGVRVGVPKPSSREFFGDDASEAAFAADITAVQALGATLVEIDLEPFYAVARLLYEGPWVAERYAALRRLIETTPEVIHPVTRGIIENARKFDAPQVFEALYKLADLKRATEPVWDDIDLLLVPTLPRPYTVEQVLADPVRLNSNLGTYTNFVNLLDLCALAVPSSARADGLPGSVTLIAPAGCDARLLSLGRQIQAASGLTLGGTEAALPALAPLSPEGQPGEIEIAVVGAHLSGLPLNGQLTTLGARLRRALATLPEYRLFALPGTTPPKPGLLRVASGEGAAILAEVWALPTGALGAFAAQIPAPLGLGRVRLADGSTPLGFLVEAEATRGAEDISHFGGWRAFQAK